MKYAKQVCLQHTYLWSIQIIKYIIDKDTEEVGHSPSLALDSKDIPHISYVDSDSSRVNYGTIKNGIWTFETVALNLKKPSELK
jgi:hypothetical protein